MHRLAPHPHRIPRFVAALFCLLALTAATGTASGQTPPAPENTAVEVLRVVVWPEYDRPEALVMFKAKLDAKVALPAQVSLRIPADVGRPTAVAKRLANDQLFVAEHTYEVDGDWATVTITTDSPEIQLEYYAPLAHDGNKRTFVYDWPGGGTIGQLQYEVQEPIGATNVNIVPAPIDRARRADGLVYAQGFVRERAPDAPGRIELSYEKADARLTAQILQQAQPQPPQQAAPLPTPMAPPAAAQPPSSASAEKSGPGWGMIGLLLVAAFAAGIWIGRASVADDSDDEDDE